MVLNTSLEITESLSARDVLIYFNKHIYPGIKEKFFPSLSVPVQTKKSLLNIFQKNPVSLHKQGKKQEKIDENTLYTLFGAAICRGIFDLVVGDHTTDLVRINLFLNVMWLEMTTTAFLNSWSDFNTCAEMFEDEGEKDKSRIIGECLKLCNKRFSKRLTMVSFTEDLLIFESGYGTTIQTKEEFFKQGS